MKTIKRILIPCIVLCLFLGCTAETMQDLALAPNVNAYSVVRGLVTGTSVVMSRSRVSFSQNSVTGTTSVSSTVSSSLPTKILCLLDEDGLILQKKDFPVLAGGIVNYQFEGEFRGKSLRLRVIDGSQTLEIALGSLDNSLEVNDIPPLPLKEAALATRYLEQSKQFSDLQKSSSQEFVSTLQEVIRVKVTPLDNLGSLSENMDRVGVDESGILKIFSTDYNPRMYKKPEQALSWEANLFEPVTTSSSSSPASTSTTTQIDSFSPQAKVILNYVNSLVAEAGGKSKILFQNHFYGSPRVLRFEKYPLNLEIRFSQSLPLEMREALLESARLKLQSPSRREDFNFKDLGAEFVGHESLKLELDDRHLAIPAGEFGLFLDFTAQAVRPGEISKLFFASNYSYDPEGVGE